MKIENITHNVGHSSRTGAIVEPYLCKQWFVKMKPLSQAVDKIQHSKDRTKFFPSRFSHTFQRWLDTTEDWCISRQLWWGHRIPVYTDKVTGEVICSETPLDPTKYDQDPDVLDTWFSSGLAPFAFMGWPETDELLKRYYPWMSWSRDMTSYSSGLLEWLSMECISLIRCLSRRSISMD